MAPMEKLDLVWQWKRKWKRKPELKLKEFDERSSVRFVPDQQSISGLEPQCLSNFPYLDFINVVIDFSIRKLSTANNITVASGCGG